MRDVLKDKTFWIVTGVALLLRGWHLYFAAQNPTFWAPAVDPLWYHEAALRVSHGDFGPWPLFRAPLYPWLLGLVYAVSPNDLLAARLFNLILQLATLIIIFRVAQDYFNRKAAIIGASLFAVNGMVIYFFCEILSSSLEMLMAALAAWSMLALRKSPTLKQALITGLVWGLACITRPNFLLVAPFAILFAVWPVWKPVSLRTSVLAFVGLALPILPITLGNWVYGYERVLIATQGGVNFWIGNNPQADGISSVLPGSDRFWTMDQATRIAERDARRDLGPGGVSDRFFKMGRDFWSSHPADAAKLMVRKTLLFFNRFEVSNNKHIAYFAGQTPGLSLLILLNFALLLPLALLALLRRPVGNITGLWGIVLAYAATVILFFIASRFRMPVVPWLCILAGIGVVTWSDLLSKQKLIASLAAFVLLVISVINPYNAREANIGAAYYMEGNAYLALGNYDMARQRFQSAQSDEGSRELAMLNLGVTEQRAGNLKQAQLALLDLVKRYPQSVAGWNNLGVVHEAQHDTASALNAYHRAFNIDSTDQNTRVNLTNLLFERGKRFLRDGDPVTAQLPLRECVMIEPTAQSYYHLAVAYGQNAQENAAREALARSLRLDPDYAPAVTLMEQLRAGGEVPASVKE
jgi:tetratricopeptide (TPR) repeat protein